MFEVLSLNGLNKRTVYGVEYVNTITTYFLIYGSEGWVWVNANGYKPI